MKIKRVDGPGDIEDRRGMPSLPIGAGPAGNAVDLAFYILSLAKQQPRQEKYFSPLSDLGRLQQAFDVQPPWLFRPQGAGPLFPRRTP